MQDKQATWEEARQAQNLNHKQAWGVSIGKLVFWHWSQPLAYFYVLFCFYCTLDKWQRIFGCIVAACVTLHCVTCPASTTMRCLNKQESELLYKNARTFFLELSLSDQYHHDS